MPSIVVTPKYNPFTFDELYRPLAETTKMQMALEDQYNAMEMEAAKLDYLQKSDPDAYAVVKNYENTLRGLAGELASNGLTPQSRQGVYDMRKMYSSDISPINKYISWREAQDKARQEIMMKDPTYRWEIPLDQVKYNTWKDNPDMLFRGLSGDTLAKMTQASIQHITKKWRNDADFKKLTNVGLGDYVQKIENYGLNVEDMHTLKKAIENNSQLSKEEKAILENKMNQAALDVRDEVINSTDIPQWSNYKDLEDENSPLFKWVNSNIQRGLWAGIGDQKDQVLHDANAEGKTGQGTETNINRDTVEWERIASKKDPKFIEDFNSALYGQYNFEDTINSIMQTVHSILPSVPTFNGSFTDFINTPFVELGKKFDITDTSALANSKMLLQKKAPTLAMTNMIDSKWSTSERLKVLDVITSGITGGIGAYEEINNAIDDKYKKYIDEELKKGNSDVIREIKSNERDSSGSSYGHKVNVPAIVALAWELDKAGNDKNKINMIMDKYAAMPLDRFGQIEIIDKDKYKREYSEYEIGQQLGDNALGKIRKAYDRLKAYTDDDTNDLGLFNHFVDPFDNETLVKMFKDSSLYSDDEGNLDTWNYVWDEKEKDFKAEKTGDKIAKKDIKDEQLTNVVFSGRGVFLRVQNPEGSYWYIKVNPKGGRAKVIEDNWKTMKEVIEAARKIMYKNPDKITEQDMNNYIGYKQYMQDIAIEIKKQIAESFRGTTTEKVKY